MSAHRVKLLVSVRSSAEAESALRGGADIIDIKEPTRGPLGMAAPEVCASVVQHVAGRVPVSAALGELSEQIGSEPVRESVLAPGLSSRPAPGLKPSRHGRGQDSLAEQVSEGIFASALNLPFGLSYVKIGLAIAPRNWQALLAIAFHRARPARPVAVAYADHDRVGAPPICNVLDWAGGHGAAGLLIDTAIKDGRSLFDFCDSSTLCTVINRVRREGLLVALAGSLRDEFYEVAVRLEPDIIAVRGAACNGLDRNRVVDEDAVRELTAVIEAANRWAG